MIARAVPLRGLRRCLASSQSRNYSLFSKLKSFAKPNLEEEVSEKYVVNMANPQQGIDTLMVRSDEDLGGFSTVHLDLMKGANNHPFARFKGDLSLDLPEDRPDIIRLGYAMFRTKDLPAPMLGFGSQGFHDWSSFSQLSMRVRGDYRKYFINIQADTPYPTDLYQHRLFLRTPGQWEVVTVSFANFILTNGGVIQHQERLDTSAIRSVGISLIDGQYGPYQLDIDWIKVHNGEEVVEEAPANVSIDESKENLLESSPMGGTPADTEGPVQKDPRDNKPPGKRLSVDD